MAPPQEDLWTVISNAALKAATTAAFVPEADDLLGNDPEDRGPVVTDAKVVVWQVGHDSPVQKLIIRWQASLSAASDVA